MYVREFIRTGPRRRSGDFTQWQLLALCVAWGLIFILTGIALVQS
jgi:hypothetical protein